MATVLIIDDEEIYVDLLRRWLSEWGHQAVCCYNCEDGWARLEKGGVDVILLDLRLPGMSGMQFLKRVKNHGSFRDIPVIMETALVSTSTIVEGIQQGVYYYLVKPFDKTFLLSIVTAALEEIQLRHDVSVATLQDIAALRLLQKGKFLFRTVEEAKSLSQMIAHPLQDATQTATSIAEILINAIEHGNLGITYHEKSVLMNAGEWHREVASRLDAEENRGRYAMLSVHRNGDTLYAEVVDSGKGFEWEPYLEISPERMGDPNGRGIAMARTVLKDLTYHDIGNRVTFTLSLEGTTSVEELKKRHALPVV